MTNSLAQSLAYTSPVDWAHDWLARANFPDTADNLRVVYSWEYAESGGGGGMWNPLNTTQGGYPGESDLNSVGVKNYTTREDGLNANAKVIHNGYYPIVVGLFGLGNNAAAIAHAIEVSPWGTHHLPLVDVPGGVPVPEKVRPMWEPPLQIAAALARPGGGAWVAQPDGIVYFVREGHPPLMGGMTSIADRTAFAGRTVAGLLPRRFGLAGIHHGYTILATSGETYVPSAQH
jgi:hypothetical protein